MSRELQAYRTIAQQGARDELILSHLALVRHVAGRLMAELPSGTDTENLEAAGTLGLVEAATSFDPGRNVDFRSYAYLRIRGAMIDELRRSSPLSQQMMERVRRIRKAYETLSPPVSVEKLAEATGLSADELADCLAAMRLTRMQTCNPGGPEGRDLCDHQQQSPLAHLEQAEEAEQLARAIEGLPLQQQLVVTLYYREDLRLREIGDVLQLSESRISRLLSTALFTLREALRPRDQD